MPSRRISPATCWTPSSSACMPAGASSQPRRLAMARPTSSPGAAPHAETSRRQMRPMRWCPSSASLVRRAGSSWRDWAMDPVYNQEIMINVTETAASKITELLQEENKTEAGLRVFVQGGGCSGFQYGLMIDEGEGDAT